MFACAIFSQRYIAWLFTLFSALRRITSLWKYAKAYITYTQPFATNALCTDFTRIFAANVWIIQAISYCYKEISTTFIGFELQKNEINTHIMFCMNNAKFEMKVHIILHCNSTNSCECLTNEHMLDIWKNKYLTFSKLTLHYRYIMINKNTVNTC